LVSRACSSNLSFAQSLLHLLTYSSPSLFFSTSFFGQISGSIQRGGEYAPPFSSSPIEGVILSPGARLSFSSVSRLLPFRGFADFDNGRWNAKGSPSSPVRDSHVRRSLFPLFLPLRVSRMGRCAVLPSIPAPRSSSWCATSLSCSHRGVASGFDLLASHHFLPFPHSPFVFLSHVEGKIAESPPPFPFVTLLSPLLKSDPPLWRNDAPWFPPSLRLFFLPKRPADSNSLCRFRNHERPTLFFFNLAGE